MWECMNEEVRSFSCMRGGLCDEWRVNIFLILLQLGEMAGMEKSEHRTIVAYISEIDRIYRTGKATEHTYRGVLQQMLSALMPGFTILNEPKKQECGAPDYIITDRAGSSVSFVEAKDIGDDDLDGKKRTGHKEQFDRYKAALPSIIFTDYLDFHLYVNKQLYGSVRIADWDGKGRVKGKPENYGKLVELIGNAAKVNPQNIDSAKRLADLMAAKARMLQNAAFCYLKPLLEAWDRDEVGRSDVIKVPLLDLLLGMREVLTPDIGAEEFSDVFAQTLTYGMFAARLNDPTQDSFTRHEAMGLIPKTNPFLQKLFSYVATNLEDELAWIVDDLVALFRSADVAKIMRDYGRTGADPMIHFYEDFLAAYDAGLRKDRGVWYTPIQVVKFIVGAADWALRTRFGLENGLADSEKTEIEVEETAFHGKKLSRKVKKFVHRVQLLDPATGTGTFIAEAIRQIYAKFSNNKGKWPGYAANDLLPRLNGFELLMASYTMAHIKIDFALRETGVVPSGKERFRVFLTDSLSDWHKELPGGLFASALAPEQQGADEVKRDTPVMVVMGNPPYSGESQNKGEWIMKLMEDYKVEPGGKSKLQERNPKWLNDDYVKFIRLAEHYVEKNGSGIVAYITPHGFLDNPTFRGMRWHLMQTFDEIWTLNLHGNSKKKEVPPEGGKDECVFNIMQGVAITLMVKKKDSVAKNTKSAKIHYADLWGRKKDKLAELDKTTMDLIDWKDVQPAEPMLFFTPRDTAGEAEWNAGFGIAEIFSVNLLGPNSHRDGFAISFTESEALARKSDFLNKSLSDAVIREKYGLTDNRDWQLSEMRRVVEITFPCPSCLYRPFDFRFMLYSESVFDYLRPLVNDNLLKPNMALIGLRQNKKDVGVFVTDKPLGQHKIADPYDGSYVFPLYLYEENMGKVEKRANMNPEIVAKIADTLRASASPREINPQSPEDIFDYIYGVLHSPTYRAKFKEFLKVDFPRIPYPKDLGEFARFRDAGRELRMAHLMKDAAPSVSELCACFPVAGDNIVDKVEWENGRVYINSTQYFDNVPVEAWEQPIGGYRPAEKWLKDRKGRVLTNDDTDHYQRIILALAKTRAIMDGLK